MWQLKSRINFERQAHVVRRCDECSYSFDKDFRKKAKNDHFRPVGSCLKRQIFDCRISFYIS